MNSQTSANRPGQVLPNVTQASRLCPTRLSSFTFLAFILAQLFASAPAAPLDLPLRSRTEKTKDTWESTERREQWDAAKTAVVICDMWDTHTCPNSAVRVAEMAPRVNEFAKAARARGALIIHCPSDVTKFYADTPQRRLAQSAPIVDAPVPLQRWCHLDPAKEAPLPIDDTDGGCDCARTWKEGDPYPWTRQHPAIEIADGDALTETAEAYYLMRQRGIENVLVCGVHLNMCVLGRPFSIRQLVAQGLHVALVRDLTDTMYNPARRPWVNHFAGTDLMIEHVEKYWCPSTTSAALLGGEPFHFAANQPPHIVFLVGEGEYHTAETVPAWARRELESRGVRCTFLIDDMKSEPDFPQLAELEKADALFVCLRRRSLPAAQLATVRKFAESGKPVLGIRTATHAFAPKENSAGRTAWETFDRDIFGGWYQNHYGGGPATLARIETKNAAHPILTGVPTGELRFSSSLYKSRDLAATTTVLMSATIENQPDVREPIAWTNIADHRKTFYTSLGSPDDFATPAFRRLLLNASLWSVNLPIPPADAVLTP
jgi:nicotinamidase-related amidase/type 1 glutamine amidotransferase